jgi:probable F420-dependent oxidoreductase
MDLSIALPTSGSWATPANVATIAREAEARGCHGLWTFQRVLYPVGSEMPSVYLSVLDPLVALGYAAALTTRPVLGLAVVNGPFFAPAVLAKQLTTIDVLSNGRLVAGLGLGWNPDEYATVGLPTERRGRRFDEWLDCLNALMSDERVEFEGTYYRVPSAIVLPRPVQRPRPPVLIGGSTDAAYRRAGVRGDGWIASSRASLDDIAHAMATMREAAAKAGRSPDALRSVVRGVTILRDRPVEGSDRRLLHGSIDQITDDLVAFERVGVDELFFDLNFDSDEVGNLDADAEASMQKARTILAHCLA